MKNKKELLLQCIKAMMQSTDHFHMVEDASANWVYERLFWHKLLPTAASLNNQNQYKSQILKGAFEKILIQNFTTEQRYFDQAKQLFSGFVENGIQYIPYKGPFWASLVYPAHISRHIGDIDLLLSKDNARAASDVLKTSGYQPEIMGHSEEDDFTHRGGLTFHPNDRASSLTSVQLHWELMSSPRFTKKYFIRTTDFSDTGQMTTWKSLQYTVPRPEIRLLYHILHATCQHQFNRLLLIADMAALIKKYPQLDWKFLFELAKDRGCLIPLYCGLLTLNKFLTLPEAAREGLSKTPIKLITHFAAALISEKSLLTFNAERGKIRRKFFRFAMSH
jgi:hypothetical protein